MRVKELAELTGTTVRTIRYYHQIGLLPVPDQVSGIRDYGMAHLARLLRIRWLVDSGVALATVRCMLDESAGDRDELEVVRTDLNITLTGVDERLAQLQGQREQLHTLLRTIADGGPVSPMPRAVHTMYDRLIERAGDREVAAVITAERQVVEFACYRTELPPMVIELADRIDDEQLDLILEMFVELRDLDRSMNTMSRQEVDRHVREMARHAAEFVGSLQLPPETVGMLLAQASPPFDEYVGYATTTIFPERLQVVFRTAFEDGLTLRGLLSGPPSERTRS